jgi:hypothetical protein
MTAARDGQRARPPAAGYSGTPLAQKLGLLPGSRVLVLGSSRPYDEVVAPLPGGIELVARPTKSTDLVHLFATGREELARRLATLRPRLRPEVPVWVSWPKKSARVPTDLTEDVVREIALPLGFVDVKVCAVDAVWSGLKLVVRKKLR